MRVQIHITVAVEEHILRCWDEDVLLLCNDNTIVVGRNQNTAEEIDRSYADANGTTIYAVSVGAVQVS